MAGTHAVRYHFQIVKNKFHWSEWMLAAFGIVVMLAMVRHAIVYAGL
jgi:hypothetical protein